VQTGRPSLTRVPNQRSAAMARNFVLFAASLVAVLAADAGAGPITKVLTLLKDMQKELEAEAKQDKETYEQLKCWCDSNGAGKGQAVQDQKDSIDQLNSLIEGSSGKKGELTTEIEGLKKDIAESRQALAEATELRKKEAAEFHTEETELIKSVTLLKGAIVALSKHHAGLLQSDSELTMMQPALRKLVHQNLQRLNWLSVSRDKDALLSFINANDDILESDTPVRGAFDGIAMLQRDSSSIPVSKSYAPQSGAVFGILKQMKEAFEIDLPEIQKDEANKAQQFNLLKGEKESEIAEYDASVKEKTGILATTKEALATAKGDLKDTKASLSADQAFLLEMTERCTKGDYEWERRQKMRSDEIEGVSQAIVILDSDEVRDGQAEVFKGFMQRTSVTLRTKNAQRRARAVALLNKVVQHSPAMAFLLLSAKTDPFKKVIAAIDDLSAKLKVEMADEVKHKDFCVNELHENKVDEEKKQAKLDNLESKLQDLDAHKKKVEDTISALKADILNTQTEMQRASEDRKAENREFQTIVADQIRTIGALKAAHAKLGEFYFKDAFVQEPDFGAAKAAGVEASPQFEAYESNGNSNKVMNMIQKLQGESQVVKDNAVSDEQNAADAYVKLVGESNESVKAKSKAVVDKTEELSDTEQGISQATISKGETLRELESLAATKGDLHAQCDFLLKNFAARQGARSAELDALAEVKGILGGMK